MSEGGKQDRPAAKPAIHESAPSLARKIADYQGEPAGGQRGFAAIHAHQQTYFRQVEYRFSDGKLGEPPLATYGAARGAPIREHAAREHHGRVMRKAEGAATRPAIPSGGGSSLPGDVRARMEPKLGADLSGVKVHTGGESARASTGFGARAFTVGSDIHFNSGEFAPGTKEGDRLLAHELTHVVQGQKSGVQRKEAEGAEAEAEAEHGEVSSPEDAAEKEADAVADNVTEALHDDQKGDHKGDDKKSADKKGDKDKPEKSERAEKHKAEKRDEEKQEAKEKAEGKDDAQDKGEKAEGAGEKPAKPDAKGGDAKGGADDKKGAGDAVGKEAAAPVSRKATIPIVARRAPISLTQSGPPKAVPRRRRRHRAAARPTGRRRRTVPRPRHSNPSRRRRSASRRSRSPLRPSRSKRASWR